MEDNKINGWRIFFAVVYFLIPILFTSIFSEKIFFADEEKGIGSIFRLSWCISSSMIGFSILVFETRYNPKSVFPSYLTYYPALLLVISTLVFSFLHLFEKTTGYIFYYFSFPLCFILSFLVDSFWNLFYSLLEKAKAKIDN